DAGNRCHAIFTQGHGCVMVNPSTLAPVLLAFGAVAQARGPGGRRDIPLARFFQAPSNAGQREHVLTPDEVLVSVSFLMRTNWKNGAYEVRQKQSYDWPPVQAAVNFGLDGNAVRMPTIVP